MFLLQVYVDYKIKQKIDDKIRAFDDIHSLKRSTKPSSYTNEVKKSLIEIE